MNLWKSIRLKQQVVKAAIYVRKLFNAKKKSRKKVTINENESDYNYIKYTKECK